MSNSARVITLTPAPAIDRTYLVDSLHLGEVHRARESHAELAGKGVNVSSGLVLAGIPSLAVVPLTREEAASADDEIIYAHTISHLLRVNITVLDDDGHTTKINEKAPPLTTADWTGLVETTLSLAREHQSPWILLAGTIPSSAEGAALDLQALFESAHSQGILVGLDTSGSPLLELARSGLPDVIKPNAPELAECVGRPLLTLGDVVEAAQEVQQWGVTHVLVSLGPDHPDEFAHAVARGVAWGALKVQEVSSQLQSLEGLPDVTLTDSPEHGRMLLEPGVI